MTSLLDIADLSKTVTIRGKEVAVFGVSAKDIAGMLDKFPELRPFMSGGAGRDKFTPDAMIKMAPAAVAAAIAAGTGSGGDLKAEAVAARLGLGEQLELLTAIFDLTFPKGVGPFVATLEKLGVLKAAASGKAAVTKSPEPSSGSSPAATPAEKSGQ